MAMKRLNFLGLQRSRACGKCFALVFLLFAMIFGSCIGGEAQSDPVVARNLGAFFEAFLGRKTRKALEHCQQALTYWHVTNNEPEQAHTLGLIAEINFDLNEMRKALGYYQQALSLFHEIGDQKRQGAILTLMADTHRVLHEAQKANEH